MNISKPLLIGAAAFILTTTAPFTAFAGKTYNDTTVCKNVGTKDVTDDEGMLHNIVLNPDCTAKIDGVDCPGRYDLKLKNIKSATMDGKKCKFVVK